MKFPPNIKPRKTRFLSPPFSSSISCDSPDHIFSPPTSPASLFHHSQFPAQDKCAPNSFTSILLPQPRTLFSQPIAWLIPSHPSGVSMNVTSSERIREVKLLEQRHTANMQIHANRQPDSRALALTILKYKPSFKCTSCDGFLPFLAQLPFIVYFTSVCFVSLLFLFPETIPTKVTDDHLFVKSGENIFFCLCFPSVFDTVDYFFKRTISFPCVHLAYRSIFFCGFLCFYRSTFSVFFWGLLFHCLPFRCWCFKVLPWSYSCCILRLLPGRFIHIHGFSHHIHTDCLFS